MNKKDMRELDLKLSSASKQERLAALERLHILLREKEGDPTTIPLPCSYGQGPIERRMASWAGKLAQNKVQGAYPEQANRPVDG
jgi:hypothetical protein